MFSQEQKQAIDAITQVTARRVAETIERGAFDAADEIIMPHLARDLASGGREGFESRATLFVYNAISALSHGQNFQAWVDGVYQRICQFADGSLGAWWSEEGVEVWEEGMPPETHPQLIGAEKMSGAIRIKLKEQP